MNLRDQVTVVCANLNAIHAFDLMWRSFCHHHSDDIPLFVWDNGSTDGCKELGRKYAARFVDGPTRMHGACLDELCGMVDTPWVLTVDNDVEFLAPTVRDMISLACAGDAFCVCPVKRYDMGEVIIQDSYEGPVLCKGQERIDPCCALFETRQLKWFLEWTSFAAFRCTQKGKHYDTGSMLYHVAKAADETVLTPNWLWDDKIRHFGEITWGLGAPEGSEQRMTVEQRYAEIQERLALYQ